MISGPPPSPVTGAHSRGDSPRNGRCQNEARRNNAEIQKPALALSAGHVSIGNPFGPSVVANANAAGGTMVPKRAGLGTEWRRSQMATYQPWTVNRRGVPTPIGALSY